MTDNVQLVKEKLDITDFLRQYLKLMPAGKNFKAVCPFHKEKTPSFMISPDRQVWHCFGCAAGGDIFSFVMKYENIEFFDALKILAEKAGIELRHVATGDQRKLNVIYEINNSAKEYFRISIKDTNIRMNMNDTNNTNPYRYALGRGLKSETIEEFEIGYAPAGSDILLRYLISAGYEIGDIERAGLIFKTDRGSYYDRFRDRLMFPIQNHFGKVVGFTGRVLPQANADVNSGILEVSSGGGSLPAGRHGVSGEQKIASALPKYVNSPETPIFHKSKILFGFDKSKNAIRDSRTAVLVEGQMDFLMMWQDGIKNIVASSGTALTPDHLSVLRRLADTLVLIFDNDEAGQAASERAIDLAQSMDFTVRVVHIETGKDPADFVNERPGELQAVVAKAMPAMEFYFERYLKTFNREHWTSNQLNVTGQMSNGANRKRSIRVVLSKIKSMASAVEQAEWLKELSLRTGLREDVLKEEMANLFDKIDKIDRIDGADKIDKTNRSRKELIAEQLISLAVSRNWSDKLQPHLVYLPSSYREFLNDPQFSLQASLIVQDMDEGKATAYFNDLTRQLQREHLKEQRAVASEIIKKAEREGDENSLRSAMTVFDKINREIQNI